MSAFDFAFGGAFLKDCDFAKLSDLYEAKCRAAADKLSMENASATGLGWLALPDIDLAEIKKCGEWLKGFDAVIHIGIGGSALGNLMLNQALLGDCFNETKKPEFYVADNPDPVKLTEFWEKVKDKTIALVCASKSGQTAETMTQFMWLYSKLEEKGNAADSVLVITDAREGLLRAFAQETGCKSLELPSTVGGRYSVFSSVGLAAAYALGVDIDELLKGAREMREKLLSQKQFADNPAWIWAALHVYHETQGRCMSVLMPYTSRLVYFAEWFAQLWGESLGKEGHGTTPVRVSGAIDQHSQLQLYTEGPDDKVITIINVKQHSAKVQIPVPNFKAFEQLNFLNSVELGEMMQLEAKSTASSIMKVGHPVIWLELERLDEKTLGGLVFFYEYMTALTGFIMEINPFDQPGVEQGKRYTYGLLGRAGYEADAAEVSKYYAKMDDICCKL